MKAMNKRLPILEPYIGNLIFPFVWIESREQKSTDDPLFCFSQINATDFSKQMGARLCSPQSVLRFVEDLTRSFFQNAKF